MSGLAKGRTMLVDGLIAIVLAATGILAVEVGVATSLPTADRPGPALRVALALALILPLAFRRRFPLTVLLVVTAVFFPYRILEVPDLTISVVVWWLALYSAGAYGDPRWKDLVRAVNVTAALGYLAYRLLFPAGTVLSGSALLGAGFLIVFNLFFVVAAWTFGDTMATRRAYEAMLLDRAAQLEREREERARRAVFDERVRIAREVHDVVAHHVSVMGVQAGAARSVLDATPEKAREALSAIEHASRNAVQELDRLVGFLRQEDEVDRIAPQPSLRHLDDLTSEISAAGLRVKVNVHGDAGPLPPTVDVSAYRMIQEALTNTMKHANATTVTIAIRYGSNEIEVDVVDDGRPRDASGRAGHGLIGMRERAKLLNGRLQAGPSPQGGFAVHAVLPVNGTER